VLAMSAMPEIRGRPWLILSIVVGSMALGFLLEYTGTIDPTYLIKDGYLVTTSDIFDMQSRTLDKAVLIIANLVFVALVGWLAYNLNDRRVRAQRQLHIQAWHLRQLIETKPITKFKTPKPR
jgi:hypothetical protein